ncbi:MAG: protein-disulfide reductase DsbD domain-containing protein [Agriterribacter sp.]
MKKIFLLAISVLSIHILFAQSGSAKMVNWQFASKKLNDNTYELRFTAGINGNYHIYAQNVGVDGPVPTTFTFGANPLLSLDGKVKEIGKMVKKHEEVWDGNVNFYEKSVEFVQVVKLKKKIKTNITGKVEFMVCNDKECLPPSEVPFKLAVGG